MVELPLGRKVLASLRPGLGSWLEAVPKLPYGLQLLLVQVGAMGGPRLQGRLVPFVCSGLNRATRTGLFGAGAGLHVCVRGAVWWCSCCCQSVWPSLSGLWVCWRVLGAGSDFPPCGLVLWGVPALSAILCVSGRVFQCYSVPFASYINTRRLQARRVRGSLWPFFSTLPHHRSDRGSTARAAAAHAARSRPVQQYGTVAAGASCSGGVRECRSLRLLRRPLQGHIGTT
jgi:hypothetical protein